MESWRRSSAWSSYKSGSAWKPVAGLELTVDGTRPGDDATAETRTAGLNWLTFFCT